MNRFFILLFVAIVLTLILLTLPYEEPNGPIVSGVQNLALLVLNPISTIFGLSLPLGNSPVVSAFVAGFLVSIYHLSIVWRIWWLRRNGGLSNHDAKRRIDSVYFLGFVLTLTSLVIALGSSSIEDPAITLAQNAIALSSTAVALVLRSIWLMRQQDEPVLEAEKDATDAFEKLQSQVASLSNDVNLAQQMFSSGQQKLNFHLETIISSSSKFFTQAQQQISDEAQKTIKEFNSKVKTLSGALADKAAKLEAIEFDGPKIEAQIVEAGRSGLSALQTEIGELSTQLATLKSSSADASESLGSIATNFDPEEGIRQAAQSLFEPLKEANDNSEQALTKLTEQGKAALSRTINQIGVLEVKIAARVEEFDERTKVPPSMIGEQPTLESATNHASADDIARLTSAIETLTNVIFNQPVALPQGHSQPQNHQTNDRQPIKADTSDKSASSEDTKETKNEPDTAIKNVSASKETMSSRGRFSLRNLFWRRR